MNVECSNRLEFLLAIYWFAYKWFGPHIFPHFFLLLPLNCLNRFVCLELLQYFLIKHTKKTKSNSIYMLHEGNSMNDMPTTAIRLWILTNIYMVFNRSNKCHSVESCVGQQRLPIIFRLHFSINQINNDRYFVIFHTAIDRSVFHSLRYTWTITVDFRKIA